MRGREIRQESSPLTKKDVFEILKKRFENDRIDSLSKLPHPHTMPGNQKAAKRVKEAVIRGEPITIVGDYDVDGVVSAAILEEFLTSHGADVRTIIPCRFNDGYGLGISIVERVQTPLIITVDNGIAAVKASHICNERGIELIIIDHHTIGDELPVAHAIVHPKLNEGFAYGEICAAAVVWYFLAALKIELSSNDNLKEYLDLVSIATIADVMPLRDINRVIVKAGIECIKNSKRPAMLAIKQRLAKEEFSSTDIAYKISPRLNSAGRLVLAKEAFLFLRAPNIKDALRLFDKLNELNEERKKIETLVTGEAASMVKEDDTIIVVAKEGWHEGVVGIVASRLVQAFKKPAIVLSIDGESAKGSARSVGNINIFELINTNSHLLTNFGGHKMAAGVSLEAKNIDAFREALQGANLEKYKENEICQKECLGEMDFCEIDEELVEILDKFEPYGESNEKPIFFGRQKRLSSVKKIGADAGFRATVECKEKKLRAVCFRKSESAGADGFVDFRFSVYKNDYTGGQVELLIEEIIAS